MNSTTQGARFLSMVPPADAAAIVAEVEAAHTALPQLRPGVRSILIGMLWRLETGAYHVSFAELDGQPVIVSGALAPEPKRKGKRHEHH